VTLTYHRAVVLERRHLSPHLVRLELGGNGQGTGFDTWRSAGVPDEALQLVVPDPANGRLTMPDARGDGEDPYEHSRWYTVRRHDPERQQITIDVVLHDTGLVTTWVQQVRPGDPVGVSSTRHWFSRPPDATWQLLVGDITALPAIGRIIGQTPGHVATTAYVELPDSRDAQDLGSNVEWVHNPAPESSSGLADIVSGARLPDGVGYVYVAGEAAATRAARKNLRRVRGLSKESYGVIGYWRAGNEAWMRRYEQAQIDLEKVYAEGERAGLDPEQISDEVDRLLDSAGL